MSQRWHALLRVYLGPQKHGTWYNVSNPGTSSRFVQLIGVRYMYEQMQCGICEGIFPITQDLQLSKVQPSTLWSLRRIVVASTTFGMRLEQSVMSRRYRWPSLEGALQPVHVIHHPHRNSLHSFPDCSDSPPLAFSEHSRPSRERWACGASAAALCSSLKRSPHATSGRQKNWSTRTMTTAMVASAHSKAWISCACTAVVTYEPMPGKV